MATNAARQRATVRWGVRVAEDAIDRLTEVAYRANLMPAQLLAYAFDAIGHGARDTELWAYLEAHRGVEVEGRTWKPWRFDVPPATVVQAEQAAVLFDVTRQSLVTHVIDCLTAGRDDGGRPVGLCEELLRLIYNPAPSQPNPPEGSPNPAEASTA